MGKNTRVVAASIAALFLAVIVTGAIYYYVIPFINKDAVETRPELLWEGEITDKKFEFQIDHEVYFLEINGTTWMDLANQQSLYNKYPVGTFVFYIQTKDGHVLVTDPSPYLV